MDNKKLDLEKWGRLLKTDDFQVVINLLNDEIDFLRKRVEDRNVQPSSDRAYELMAYTGQIAVLKRILAKIEFNKQQILKYTKGDIK